MQTASFGSIVPRAPVRVVRRSPPILVLAARDSRPRRPVPGAFLEDRQQATGRGQSEQAVGLRRALEALAEEEPTWEDAEWQ